MWPFSLLVVSLLVGGSASAQSDYRENPAADRFVAEGIALRARGRDNEALRAFQRAAEIDPNSARVQIHLATVYQALGNWLLADEYLSMAMAQQNHPYVNRHREALEDAKKVIDANVGRLEVVGEPAGAEVRLNGRLVGTLPLSPIRSTIGSYLLEVRRAGHYPWQRPIVISGGTLVREAVRLEPLPADGLRAPGNAGAGAVPLSDATADQERSPWLTWALAGGAGLAGAVTLGAVVYREVHAGRWNDDAACLAVDRTREQLCGDERDKVEAADSVAWVSGILSGVLATGAALSGFGVFESEAPPGAVGLSGCRVGLSGASCFGTF